MDFSYKKHEAGYKRIITFLNDSFIVLAILAFIGFFFGARELRARIQQEGFNACTQQVYTTVKSGQDLQLGDIIITQKK